MLLASAGATNTTIREALVDLLGKPVEECDALAIPTSSYGLSSGPERAWVFAAGQEPRCPMVELGWRSVGLLELSILPSVGRERWEQWVRAVDVLLVNGGDPMFLAHWLRESGLADLLPSLESTVWFGYSAGSMVLTPRIGEDFVMWSPPGGGDTTLGLVDFAIFPHLDHPSLPDNHMRAAEQWAAGLGIPAYAIDDDTAIVVDGDEVSVVSEGHWRYFSG
ncbi:MAG: Type 1 glutamine amidotransferase-like domain-containing protein [Candidatus Nanopelagicales bacterium]